MPERFKAIAQGAKDIAIHPRVVQPSCMARLSSCPAQLLTAVLMAQQAVLATMV
jgi:hypothetical protein